MYDRTSPVCKYCDTDYVTRETDKERPMAHNYPPFSQIEQDILRSLAEEVKKIADLPVQADRVRRWKAHNSLKSTEPMILIFPEGSWDELIPESSLSCSSPLAQKIEMDLRRRIYYHEHFSDDTVIEEILVVEKTISHTGWGLEPKQIHGNAEKGSWHVDPVLLEPSDAEKLKLPDLITDPEDDTIRFGMISELLGDILDVQLKGITHISYHLMQQYSYLRGLEETYMDMYDNPDLIHQVMGHFVAGHKQLLQQWEEAGLLGLNNDNTYHSSGGNSFTDELPAPGFSGKPRPKDLWASAESQELASVSSTQHREFALEYEKQLLKPFGLTGYGCCEPLDQKLPEVTTIGNMRRISISPWADIRICSPQLEDRYIFSWKPAPQMLVGTYDPKAIENYLEDALQVCQGNVFEMVLKDTHTLENRPERMETWSRIARRLSDQYR